MCFQLKLHSYTDTIFSSLINNHTWDYVVWQFKTKKPPENLQAVYEIKKHFNYFLISIFLEISPDSVMTVKRYKPVE